MAHSLQYTRRVYENVNSWYTSADNKAQILLTLNGIFLGFLTTSLFMGTDELEEIICYFGAETVAYLALMATCITVSTFSALMCLRSRLPKTKPLRCSAGTMWFFGHISNLNDEEFREKLHEVDEDLEIDALAAQLPTLSRNVLSKHKWVNRGFALLISSLLFFVLMSGSYLARVTFYPIAFFNFVLVVLGVLFPLGGLVVYWLLKNNEDKKNMPSVDSSNNN